MNKGSGQRTYLQPRRWLVNAVLDAAELQHGRMTEFDAPAGVIGYETVLYGRTRRFLFTIEDMPGMRSKVTLDVTGENGGPAALADMQFALLESLMAIA
jgi:hypothetical protein